MALPGYNVMISVSTGASATYSEFDGIMNFSIGDSNEMLDITDFADSRLRRRIAGLRDIQVSVDGDLEPAAAAYLKLRAAYVAGEATILQVLIDSNLSAASRSGAAYSMLVENLERSAGVEGKVAVSVSLQHEGAVDPITIGTGL